MAGARNMTNQRHFEEHDVSSMTTQHHRIALLQASSGALCSRSWASRPNPGTPCTYKALSATALQSVIITAGVIRGAAWQNMGEAVNLKP